MTLTEFTAQKLYVCLVDFGDIGIGSADLTTDTDRIQQEYDDAIANEYPALVWVIEGGMQIDVTDIFEKRRADADAWEGE